MHWPPKREKKNKIILRNRLTFFRRVCCCKMFSFSVSLLATDDFLLRVFRSDMWLFAIIYFNFTTTRRTNSNETKCFGRTPVKTKHQKVEETILLFIHMHTAVDPIVFFFIYRYSFECAVPFVERSSFLFYWNA